MNLVYSNEAVMVHTKSIPGDMTFGYKERCRFDFEKKWKGCYVAYPWPNGKVDEMNNHNANGMEYNCFLNKKLETYWLPRLQKALAKRQASKASAISR